MRSESGENAGNAHQEAATDSRALIRTAFKASLATFDAAPDSGQQTPYASIVITATAASGAPLLLISTLARHTKNLAANPRASLLFDATGPTGDLSTSARVTVIGSFEKTTDEAVARRFLSRHPDAEMYASFSDFAFFEMTVENAHFVGGFGRIVDIQAADLLVSIDGADELLAAEPDIIEHMNQDHADTLALYAEKLLGADGGQAWRMTAIDPEGFDIVGNSTALRLQFETRITTPDEARQVFKSLATKARAQG